MPSHFEPLTEFRAKNCLKPYLLTLNNSTTRTTYPNLEQATTNSNWEEGSEEELDLATTGAQQVSTVYFGSNCSLNNHDLITLE